MLTVINDQKKINSLYGEFQKVLKAIFPKARLDANIRHQGGATGAEVFTTKNGNFWTCAASITWNPFGLGTNWSMVVQINFSDANSKMKSIAVFAEDENGQPVILHRGNIGGGRVGIGKTLLMENTLSPLEYVLDGSREVEMILVGELRSKLFPAQLQQFISEVHRVKSAATSGPAATTGGLEGLAHSLFKIDSSIFKSEATRITTLLPAKLRILRRTHGLIIEALARRLRLHFKASNWQVTNDLHRDLILTKTSKVKVLFEIKTTATTQDVATALGQLLLYSARVSEPLRRIMVLPERLNSEVEQYLRTLGVECLYFDGLADNPRFIRLPTLLATFA